MTRRDIAFLACRILALWLFVQAALNLSAVLVMFTALAASMFGHTPWRARFVMTLISGLPGVVQFVAGVLLWWKSAWFARRMAPAEETEGVTALLDARTVMAIACAAVGLFLAVPAVRQLAQFLLVAVRYSDEDLYSNGTGIDFVTQVLPAILQALLAIWLIFGARGIARVVHVMRTYPNLRPPAED